MNANKQNIENSNLSRLIKKLKTEDLNYASISKAIQVVYLILIPVYILLTIFEYFENKDVNVILSGAGFICSFVIFIVFFRKYYNDYKYVDYSLPTILMLKKAVYRYQPFQKRSLWVLLAIFSMDFGLTINWIDANTPILKIQAIFLGAVVFAIVVGLVLWYVKYKPIRDEALRMIKEIEEI